MRGLSHCPTVPLRLLYALLLQKPLQRDDVLAERQSRLFDCPQHDRVVDVLILVHQTVAQTGRGSKPAGERASTAASTVSWSSFSVPLTRNGSAR